MKIKLLFASLLTTALVSCGPPVYAQSLDELCYRESKIVLTLQTQIKKDPDFAESFLTEFKADKKNNAKDVAYLRKLMFFTLNRVNLPPDSLRQSAFLSCLTENR